MNTDEQDDVEALQLHELLSMVVRLYPCGRCGRPKNVFSVESHRHRAGHSPTRQKPRPKFFSCSGPFGAVSPSAMTPLDSKGD